MIGVMNSIANVSFHIIDVIRHLNLGTFAEYIECLAITQNNVASEGAVTVGRNKVLFGINTVWHGFDSFLGSLVGMLQV